jgi:hypothetical protein
MLHHPEGFLRPNITSAPTVPQNLLVEKLYEERSYLSIFFSGFLRLLASIVSLSESYVPDEIRLINLKGNFAPRSGRAEFDQAHRV